MQFCCSWIIAFLMCLLVSGCSTDPPQGDPDADIHDGGDAEAGSDGDADSDADADTDSDIIGADSDQAQTQHTDPGCIDGQYRETLPDPNASIEELVSAYDPSEYQQFILDVLSRRYPLGAYIVEEARNDQSFGDCVDVFLDSASTAHEIIDQLPLFVHECGHFLDLGQSTYDTARFVITEELSFDCPNGGSFDVGGQTFARSRIRDDSFGDARPPCVHVDEGPDCDGWANVYLSGDPEDDEFEDGDQGFDSLLEEMCQYVGSLATSYAFQSELPETHERDGSLTFLWYVQRYLHHAREEYPETYQLLSTNQCWREAILTVWGRAWLYLDATASLENIGVYDDRIEPLVADPALLGEIQRLRDLQGCS